VCHSQVALHVLMQTASLKQPDHGYVGEYLRRWLGESSGFLVKSESRISDQQTACGTSYVASSVQPAVCGRRCVSGGTRSASRVRPLRASNAAPLPSSLLPITHCVHTAPRHPPPQTLRSTRIHNYGDPLLSRCLGRTKFWCLPLGRARWRNVQPRDVCDMPLWS